MMTHIESSRGCGYRKPGGLYMVGGKFGVPCGVLPIPLTVCPCCNAGIKFSRGFAWIGRAVIDAQTCRSGELCQHCEVWSDSHEHYGLMWVGEKFYPTPRQFVEEGYRQGISKKIPAVPKEFELGKDWILLAHRKAIDTGNRDQDGMPILAPGIFQAFKPERIEYVVRGDETDEELEKLQKRGITPVKVVRDTDAQMSINDTGKNI